MFPNWFHKDPICYCTIFGGFQRPTKLRNWGGGKVCGCGVARMPCQRMSEGFGIQGRSDRSWEAFWFSAPALEQ